MEGDGMSIRVECYAVKYTDDYFTFHIIDDEREDDYRNMMFCATTEEAEEMANQLLQIIFSFTEKG